MTLPQPRPADAGAAAPLAAPALPAWARTQLERVLRALEGRGPSADSRIRRHSAAALDGLEGELPPAPSATQVADHLWAALLCAGHPAAARFFRPLPGKGASVLWVRRADGGADGLDRRRVEALLARRCHRHADDGLEPARMRRQCARQLRNGLGEAELVRALDLTSPAQAAVLRRLCGLGTAVAGVPGPA